LVPTLFRCLNWITIQIFATFGNMASKHQCREAVKEQDAGTPEARRVAAAKANLARLLAVVADLALRVAQEDAPSLAALADNHSSTKSSSHSHFPTGPPSTVQHTDAPCANKLSASAPLVEGKSIKLKLFGDKIAVGLGVDAAQDELAAAVCAPVGDGGDPTQWLPDELVIAILLLLPAEMLWRKTCSLVCRRWHGLDGSPPMQRLRRQIRWAAYERGVSKPVALQGHEGSIRGLVLGADGIIYSGSADFTVRRWSPEGVALTPSLLGHTDALFALAVSKTKVYSGADDKSIRVWSVEDGTLLHTIPEQSSGISALVVGHNGDVFSGSFDGTVRVWSGEDGSLLKTLEGHPDHEVVTAAVGLDGNVLTGAADCTVRVWSCGDGSLVNTLIGHTNVVFAIAIGRAGNLVFTGSADCTVRVWRGDTGAPLHTLAEHRDFVYALAVDDATGVLYSGSADTRICLWYPVHNGYRCGHQLQGHKSDVLGLVLDKRGTLISSSSDTTILMW
jgi:hypothetical protein